MAAPFPSKLPLQLAQGDLDPRIMHASLGPSDSDRQTYHASPSVAVGRIYVRSTAMRPNNNNNYNKITETAGTLVQLVNEVVQEISKCITAV